VTCPPADELVQFVAGTLPADARRAVEAHLDVCDECRQSVSSAVPDPREPARFGRYRIDGELGQGGMGIVFRAWDPQLARAVAIKVVRQGDAEHRARLVREAQSLARLSHPHVCQVYDVGQHDDEVWFAMELIDGSTLRAWATDHGPAEILDVLVAVAEGLAAAHDCDLVHRDVKPDNVLVDRRGRAVVTDFGLARILATNAGAPALTSTGAVFGSPGYMAPEQLGGAAVDARADQFSWAVTAWELLVPSARLPGDPTARIVAIASGLVPPPELPAELAALLVRALSIYPEDRFASMTELLAVLRAQTVGRPPAKRRRGSRIAMAVAVLASLGGLVAVLATARHGTAPAAIPPVLGSPVANAVDAAPSRDAAPPDDPLPAGYRRLPPLTGTTVELEKEWELARQEAIRQFPDARVDNLSGTVVSSTGTIDLAHGGMITTAFVSPSAFRKGEAQTSLSTSRGATGGYAMLAGSSGGEPRLLRWPRCSVHQVWQRAAAKRALPANGVASITYVANPYHRPTWYFAVGPIDVQLPDDC